MPDLPFFAQMGEQGSSRGAVGEQDYSLYLSGILGTAPLLPYFALSLGDLNERVFFCDLRFGLGEKKERFRKILETLRIWGSRGAPSLIPHTYAGKPCSPPAPPALPCSPERREKP